MKRCIGYVAIALAAFWGGLVWNINGDVMLHAITALLGVGGLLIVYWPAGRQRTPTKQEDASLRRYVESHWR